MITHIIWDFNGTVLDDVRTAVAAVNLMLNERNLPSTDIDTYRDTLVMPLEKYYETVGILNADIPTLSIEFREKSLENEHLSKIADDFEQTADFAIKKGIKNILMSSLFQEYLISEVNKYNISKYFVHIQGMNDTAVGSKYEMAKQYLENNNISAENVLFIGDLITDYQLAKKIGSKCILIPNGHISKERCIATGATVYESICEIKNLLSSQ